VPDDREPAVDRAAAVSGTATEAEPRGTAGDAGSSGESHGGGDVVLLLEATEGSCARGEAACLGRNQAAIGMVKGVAKKSPSCVLLDRCRGYEEARHITEMLFSRYVPWNGAGAVEG
jgi:hypothetical protein